MTDPTPLLSSTPPPSIKHSLNVLYIVTFLSSCGFAVMLPSLWPYVDSLHGSRDMLGYITTAGSAGNVIGLLIFGKTGDLWGVKNTILMTLLIGSGASLWYSIATANWMILCARAISGFAGGRITVCNAYVVKVTTVKERTGAMALMGGLTILGVCTGPAIGTLLSLPNFKIGIITINQYTAPGYMWVILSLSAFLVVLRFFVEASPRSQPLDSEDTIIPLMTPQQSLHVLMDTMDEHDISSYIQKQIGNAKITALFCILMQCLGFYVYLVLQTLIPPIIDEDYDYGSTENGIAWTCAAMVGVISYIIIRMLSKRGVTDVTLIASGILFMMLGNIFIAEFPWTPNISDLIHTFTHKLTYWRFVMGMIAMAIGFTQADAVSMSLYSKSIERWNHLISMATLWEQHQQQQPSSQQQPHVIQIDVKPIEKEHQWGGTMSIILAAQAMSRTFGPIVGTQLYDHLNNRNVFLMNSLLLLILWIIQMIWWKRMISTIEYLKPLYHVNVVEENEKSVNPTTISYSNKMRLLSPEEMNVQIEEWN